MGDTPATVHPLPFAPEGVWGINEQHVYVWGIRQAGPGDQRPHVVRFDGSTWAEMPSPGFYITKMHGLSPDLIYAAGRNGGMARWDGHGWNSLSMPTTETLSDLFVASPDELYATGHGGSLFEGTHGAWKVIARTLDERLPYAAVAKFAGELFVGGGPLGLLRRVAGTQELELVKPNLKATSFDARGGTLLITTPNMVAGTTDGVAYRGAAIDLMLKTTGSVDIAER